MCQSTDQVESGDGVAERGFTPRKASGAGVQADKANNLGQECSVVRETVDRGGISG